MISVLGFTRSTGKVDMDGPQYYRTYLPLREVNRADNDIKAQLAPSADIVGIPDDVLGAADILVMSRMYHEDIDLFLEVVHSYGAKFVLDTDDDLTETYKLVSGRGEIFKEVLGKVDYLTVSTQPLADLCAPFTKVPPTVLRNHVDTQWMTEVADKAYRIVEGLTIGVTGSPTHWGDWRVVAVPLQRIAREHDVRPVLSGEVPHYMKYVADVETRVELGSVPFSMYPVILKQFDIVLCAVDATDHFNDGKSDIKALECMTLGVVPICSRFGPYLDLAEAGAPVVIVHEDAQDAWYEAMRTIVVGAEYRKFLAESGPAWVRDHRDMANSGQQHWAEFYRSIV